MDQQTVLARTRGYVEEAFLYMRPGLVLSDRDSLFAKGVIDSMGVLELIGFVEQEFGFEVGDEDINEENLGTLADIARYVTSRSGNGAPSPGSTLQQGQCQPTTDPDPAEQAEHTKTPIVVQEFALEEPKENLLAEQ